MGSILAFLIFAIITGCTLSEPQTAQGGTGSEIVGKAQEPDSSGTSKACAIRATYARTGLPVIVGNVFAYPRLFIPDTAWATLGALPRVRTDDSGYFRIEDAPPGEVVVEANDGSGNGITHSVNVDKDSTTYDIGVLTVQKSGAIKLQATTSLPGNVRFYVGVRGTRLVVRGTQTGVDLVLDDVPSGSGYTVNIRVFEPVSLSADIPNVSVSAGLTTVLETFVIK
jgi:hypothetical protein